MGSDKCFVGTTELMDAERLKSLKKVLGCTNVFSGRSLLDAGGNLVGYGGGEIL